MRGHPGDAVPLGPDQPITTHDYRSRVAGTVGERRTNERDSQAVAYYRRHACGIVQRIEGDRRWGELHRACLLSDRNPEILHYRTGLQPQRRRPVGAAAQNNGMHLDEARYRSISQLNLRY